MWSPWSNIALVGHVLEGQNAYLFWLLESSLLGHFWWICVKMSISFFAVIYICVRLFGAKGAPMGQKWLTRAPNTNKSPKKQTNKLSRFESNLAPAGPKWAPMGRKSTQKTMLGRVCFCGCFFIRLFRPGTHKCPRKHEQ